MTRLEHVNVTVSDAPKTADILCRLFGWHIRWQGPSKMGGRSVHVGNDDQYLALYTPPSRPGPAADPGAVLSGMNHIGVTVDDLDATEARILAAGYITEAHDDYDPGRRFYFTEENGVEIEVVCYHPGQSGFRRPPSA